MMIKFFSIFLALLSILLAGYASGCLEYRNYLVKDVIKFIEIRDSIASLRAANMDAAVEHIGFSTWNEWLSDMKKKNSRWYSDFMIPDIVDELESIK